LGECIDYRCVAAGDLERSFSSREEIEAESVSWQSGKAIRSELASVDRLA
jgi:hypothetical protein